MSLRYPSDDTELTEAVRGETGYEDNSDEVPSSQMDVIVERAKGKLQMRTGVSDGAWYNDDGLAFALVAYTCMRAKAAVENISLGSYTLGQEQVSFDTDDVEDSQQLQQWAGDVADGLAFSDADDDTGNLPRNTSDYVGETYTRRNT